ncbi:hypothetical protein D9M69_696100 [compost metagenome]
MALSFAILCNSIKSAVLDINLRSVTACECAKRLLKVILGAAPFFPFLVVIKITPLAALDP